MARSGSFVLAMAWCVALTACGGAESKPAANPSTPPSDTPADAPASGGEEAEATPAGPTAAQKRPLVAESLCPEVATLGIGDESTGFEGGQIRTIARGGSSDIPRKPDGTQRVWLLDDNSEGLIKVDVTRGMKRIEVGRSCRTLDAR